MDRLDILQCAVDYLELADKTKPCPSYEPLKQDWLADYEQDAPMAVPSDEIDPAEAKKYNQYLTFVGDIFSMFLDEAKSKRWQELTLEDREAHVARILAYPQITQRTAEWYAQSKNVLTASEFASILGTERAVGALVLSKIAPVVEGSTNRLVCSTADMSALDWGVRFEPVVKQILDAKWSTKILEIGRLVHQTDKTLAASPDGLVKSAADPLRVGRLIEIKCPVRRELNGKVPFEYWCQMQIQMEVADIDECDYVEVKLASPYKDSKYVEPVDEKEAKGMVWIFQCGDTCELKYAYTVKEKEEWEALGWFCIETVPWHLDQFFSTTVQRDRVWFESTAEKRAEFWRKVADARAGINVPAGPQKRVVNTVSVCQILD